MIFNQRTLNDNAGIRFSRVVGTHSRNLGKRVINQFWGTFELFQKFPSTRTKPSAVVMKAIIIKMLSDWSIASYDSWRHNWYQPLITPSVLPPSPSSYQVVCSRKFSVIKEIFTVNTWQWARQSNNSLLSMPDVPTARGLGDVGRRGKNRK